MAEINRTIGLMNYTIFIGDVLDVFFSKSKVIVNTINPHSYCVSKKDFVFRKALQQSDVLLPDGMGIVLATLILKGIKIQQISGPTIHPIILKKLNSEKKSCFYLGSSDETLRLIEKRLQKEYPNIRAGFYSPPYKNTFTEEDNQKMISEVNAFNPDVLFVGMTAPKQEKWVLANSEQLNTKIICSIGAVFDFYAGTVKQPHPIYFKLGLVWLIRLLQEPKRLWKRNLVSTPRFLWDILLYRLGIIS